MSALPGGLDPQQYKLMLLLSQMGQKEPAIQSAPINSMGAGISEGVNNVLRIVMQRRQQAQQQAALQGMLKYESDQADAHRKAQDAASLAFGIDPRTSLLDPAFKARIAESMFPSAEGKTKLKEMQDKQDLYNRAQNAQNVFYDPRMSLEQKKTALLQLSQVQTELGHDIPGVSVAMNDYTKGDFRQMVRDMQTNGNPGILNKSPASPQMLNNFEDYGITGTNDSLTDAVRKAEAQTKVVEAASAPTMSALNIKNLQLGNTGKDINNTRDNIHLGYEKRDEATTNGQLAGTIVPHEAMRLHLINSQHPVEDTLAAIKTPESGFKSPTDLTAPIAPQPQVGPTWGQAAAKAFQQATNPYTAPYENAGGLFSNYMNSSPQQQQQMAPQVQQGISDNLNQASMMINPVTAGPSLMMNGMKALGDYYKAHSEWAGKNSKALMQLLTASPYHEVPQASSPQPMYPSIYPGTP